MTSTRYRHLAIALLAFTATAAFGKDPEEQRADASTVMTNPLNLNGDGTSNPAYGRRIKNIMIFQAGGWSGLADLERQGKARPGWPLVGRRRAYLSKSRPKLEAQMAEVKGLSLNLAIAVLLMPDAEARASGYGTCFDGNWTERGASCRSGTWKLPLSQYDNARWAAWRKGLPVAPLLSINNYECTRCPVNHVYNKLVAMVTFVTTRNDAVTLKTIEGKTVILVEGLPENTRLSSTERQKILDYMRGRQDILWIDNLANAAPSQAAANVIRSAAAAHDIQKALEGSWGDRYRMHNVLRFGRTPEEARSRFLTTAQILDQLNIQPYASGRYPVVISQWNEYAEFLMFEPNLSDGRALYDWFRGVLARQP